MTRAVIIGVCTLVVIGAAGYAAWFLWPDNGPAQNMSNVDSSISEDGSPTMKLPEETGSPVKLTGNEFKDLYRSVNYPNVTRFAEAPEITGNADADHRIRELAVARGFVLTGRPTTAIVPTGEALVSGTEENLLQPLALKAWQQLKTKADDAGVPLRLSSAYRSVERQRDLFLERLTASGVTIDQIAAGFGDDAIQETLYLTAPPGFSRHHTGYTIDLVCGDGLTSFLGSTCDQWLKQDDFAVAKQLGWIPSYPDDADAQGPEPEPWEYVWVGTRHLHQ